MFSTLLLISLGTRWFVRVRPASPFPSRLDAYSLLFLIIIVLRTSLSGKFSNKNSISKKFGTEWWRIATIKQNEMVWSMTEGGRESTEVGIRCAMEKVAKWSVFDVLHPTTTFHSSSFLFERHSAMFDCLFCREQRLVWFLWYFVKSRNFTNCS